MTLSYGSAVVTLRAVEQQGTVVAVDVRPQETGVRTDLARDWAFAGRLLFRPWLWLNMICVDAPLVAITWQWFFGRTFGVPVTAADRTALFLTAWLIYLADRVADSFSNFEGGVASMRQAFCRRYRRSAFGVLLLIAAADIFVVAQHLERDLLPIGFGLGLVALGYLIINHSFDRVWGVLPIKELAVGSLFAIGTLTVLRSRASSANGELLMTAGMFAALCVCNAVAIASWERGLDQAQGKVSLATKLPRIAAVAGVAAAALAAACFTAASVLRNLAPLFVSTGASFVLLGALDFGKRWLPRDDRTALADLALLTPLLFAAVS